MRLGIRAFALACGLLWGVGLFLTTWWVILLRLPASELNWIGDFYLGYTVSALGSLIGAGWAFLDGLCGGAIFAGLYNLLNWALTRNTKGQA
jgi:hypothetical protein